MLWHIINGIQSGNVHHTDSKQVCNKKEEPLMFWFLIILFTLLFGTSLYFGYKSLFVNVGS
jgi:hypothetical protein